MKQCPECGKMNHGDAKFCAECGYAFEGQADSPEDVKSGKWPLPMPAVAALAAVFALAVGVSAAFLLNDGSKTANTQEIPQAQEATEEVAEVVEEAEPEEPAEEPEVAEPEITEEERVLQGVQGVWRTVGNSGMLSVVIDGDRMRAYSGNIVDDQFDGTYRFVGETQITEIVRFEPGEGMEPQGGYKLYTQGETVYYRYDDAGDSSEGGDYLECHWVPEEADNYSASDSLVKDEWSVEEFMAMVVESGESESAETNKDVIDSVKIDTDWCSFECPAEWVGKVRMTVVDQRIEFRQSDPRFDDPEMNQSEGWLYSVVLSDLPPNPAGVTEIDSGMSGRYFEDPGTDRFIAQEGGRYVYLVHPTDVQFNANNQSAAEEYRQLYNADVDVIRRTFKLK